MGSSDVVCNMGLSDAALETSGAAFAFFPDPWNSPIFRSLGFSGLPRSLTHLFVLRLTTINNTGYS